MDSLALVTLWTALASTLGTESPEVAVSGGQLSGTCEYPVIAAIQGSRFGCTATLVHPQVVIYAAHCGEATQPILFGEDARNGGAREAEIDFCMVNPDWDINRFVEHRGFDWAFCVLKEPITDLPYTPIAEGCEVEEIQPGKEVVIAGYGDPWQRQKSHVVTSVQGITDAVVAGGNGLGGCGGDSGGPLFTQVSDGSWRTVGIQSTGFNHSECGPSGRGGDGTTNFAVAYNGIDWFEQASGFDLTPCHDDAGNWAPTPECGRFADLGSTTPGATWDDWCSVPRSGAGMSCGEPHPDAGKEPPATTGGEGEGSGTGPGTGDGGTPSDGTGEGTEGGDGGTIGELPTGTSGGASDGGGCRSAGGVPGWAVVCGVFAWRRRRDRSHR